MTRRAQDFTPRTKPLPHQREAIEYVIKTPRAALFDEQGLGKTKIVIDAFAELMRRGEIDAALVVAPMGLVYNWEAEVGKHSSLVPVVLRGAGRERKYRFLSGANFYIANYAAVCRRARRIDSDQRPIDGDCKGPVRGGDARGPQSHHDGDAHREPPG
jgi:SNF2 family DNA or RNA helicase